MSSFAAADLLLYGGRILTCDPLRPTADAIAVSGHRILAVGSEAEVRPYISPRTHLLACHGSTILPGFIDPHLHLFAWASRFCGADVSHARSIPELQRLLRCRAAQPSADEWIRGYGYDEFFLLEKRHPTRYDLDAVSQTRPILLRHRTGHAAVLNSTALRRAGIDVHFTPPAGGHVARDPQTGEPTGVLYELEEFLRTVLPPLPADEFANGVDRAYAELLRQGVTSFHDASAGNSVDDLALFRRFAEGPPRPRATMMLGIHALPSAIAAGFTPRCGDERVRLGSVKIIVHESHGILHPPPEELTALVWQVHQHGFQVAIHAVEEGAICAALTAIAAALQRLPRVDHRHRIEHCALCPPPFVDQLAETGVAVVTQPGFLYFYGEKYAAEIDPDRQRWLYRSQSLLRRGIPVAASSDCPIAPMAPLISLQAAITRQTQNGLSLNPQEGLSLSAALPLFTTAAAWVGFEEHCKGRLRPGLLADLLVLDRDLLAVPPAEIHTTSVKMTILGGTIAWSA
ncbi:MAG: amidohydrolase [Candidatus Binatia bacterium]|nr:amidohydrolase [Candidatus Binatia bacterium]